MRRKAERGMGTGAGSLSKETTASPTLPAAKLHVLQLAPIKEKIGDRWPRMSLLVHTLFENALRHAQGPQGRGGGGGGRAGGGAGRGGAPGGAAGAGAG